MKLLVFSVKFGYNEIMSKIMKKDQVFREAMHLQVIENNPLDAEDKAMFEMFERKGLSPAQRRAYILEQAKADSMVPAAE